MEISPTAANRAVGSTASQEIFINGRSTTSHTAIVRFVARTAMSLMTGLLCLMIIMKRNQSRRSSPNSLECVESRPANVTWNVGPEIMGYVSEFSKDELYCQSECFSKWGCEDCSKQLLQDFEHYIADSNGFDFIFCGCHYAGMTQDLHACSADSNHQVFHKNVSCALVGRWTESCTTAVSVESLFAALLYPPAAPHSPEFGNLARTSADYCYSLTDFVYAYYVDSSSTPHLGTNSIVSDEGCDTVWNRGVLFDAGDPWNPRAASFIIVFILWVPLWRFVIRRVRMMWTGGCASAGAKHGFLDVLFVPNAYSLGLAKEPAGAVRYDAVVEMAMVLRLILIWLWMSMAISPIDALLVFGSMRAESWQSECKATPLLLTSIFKVSIYFLILGLSSLIVIMEFLCTVLHKLYNACRRCICQKHGRETRLALVTAVAQRLLHETMMQIDTQHMSGKSVKFATATEAGEQNVTVKYLGKGTIVFLGFMTLADVFLDLNSVRNYYINGHPAFAAVTFLVFLLAFATEWKAWLRMPSGLKRAWQNGYWDDEMLAFIRSERGIEGVVALALTVYGWPWAIPDESRRQTNAAALQFASLCSGIYGVAQALYEKELDVGDIPVQTSSTTTVIQEEMKGASKDGGAEIASAKEETDIAEHENEAQEPTALPHAVVNVEGAKEAAEDHSANAPTPSCPKSSLTAETLPEDGAPPVQPPPQNITSAGWLPSIA
eukprot:TRINITY_DN12101_c0_g1_i2.p1 TRINITY_DN12101_c0_g1~~TRINITY_DN12101_c0_g1_i2.p1  ORF type:complete len:720 (+),score=58.21 TRINITY_DN12101_c0_g1_i2:356-2515(+)